MRQVPNGALCADASTTLDVPEAFAEKMENRAGQRLRDQEGVILATMTVDRPLVPNQAHEAEKVFRADDSAPSGGKLNLHNAATALSTLGGAASPASSSQLHL